MKELGSNRLPGVYRVDSGKSSSIVTSVYVLFNHSRPALSCTLIWICNSCPLDLSTEPDNNKSIDGSSCGSTLTAPHWFAFIRVFRNRYGRYWVSFSRIVANSSPPYPGVDSSSSMFSNTRTPMSRRNGSGSTSVE